MWPFEAVNMWRHYLSMAARGFLRHKLYSFINVVGLAVALTCAILILLFVRDQLSYDAWIPGTADLYRLEVTLHMIGRPPLPKARTPLSVLREMQAQIPQVKAVTYVVPKKMTVTVGDRQFLQTVTVADPDFFQVIRLPLVQGSAARVLAHPGSVVLSQSLARKYFGKADPVGKVLKVRGAWGGGCKRNDGACLSGVRTLEVTGVLRDLPHNTQLIADLVVPAPSQADRRSGKYGYVELTPGADPAKVLAELKPILDRSFHIRIFGITQSASQLEHFHLTPFRQVHLSGGRYGGMKPAGSRTTVYGFAVIAFLIALVACFNFTNLATARASLRAREIGLRKLAGARRRQLVAQFLSEAVLAALVSLAIAVSLVEILLPAYDRFLKLPIGLHYLSDWKLLAVMACGAIAVGLLSGLYPALVLSGMRPASALRSGASAQPGSGPLRWALVVAQFAVAIGLGVAAVVVFGQINFARTLDTGFDRYDMIVIRGISNMSPGVRKRLMHVLSAGPGISGVALSNAVPFDISDVGTELMRSQGSRVVAGVQVFEISSRFPSLYGMRLLAGRFLSAAHGQDVSSGSGTQNVLINAQAARHFGYSPDEAIGKEFTGGLNVVGVLANAMLDGFRGPVVPAVFQVDPDHAAWLSVRVRSDRIPEALTYIDKTWRSFAPGIAMDRYFVSDAFNGLFRSDETQGTMFGVFTVIAILIGCLGLFGLVVFTAERRTKEIGIRKISGARTGDIVRLMLWRISAPVLVANVIAWPVTYYYLHRWLEGYAYRISLGPLYFLAGGAAALAIAWMTVFAHTLRLARASPVQALRYE